MWFMVYIYTVTESSQILFKVDHIVLLLLLLLPSPYVELKTKIQEVMWPLTTIGKHGFKLKS